MWLQLVKNWTEKSPAGPPQGTKIAQSINNCFPPAQSRWLQDEFAVVEA